MEIVRRLLSELTPSEKNVRKHNRRQITEMIKAIDKFGVIRPIVIDENNTILCGHGLYEALVERGNEDAECAVISGLSSAEKKKLMLADNKIYDLGTSDFDAIDEILTEFGLEGDFSVPGYDADYLEDLYGIKSVQKEVTDYALPQAPEQGETDSDFEPIAQSVAPKPSHSVQEERQNQLSAKRIIMCPHCGEVIEL